MSNVQTYKTQFYVHGAVMPCQTGSSGLQWDRAWIVPEVSGNYSNQNAAEGLQVPSLAAQFALLNASAGTCPLDNSILQTFLTRSSDAAHDVAAIANPLFFDGVDGYEFPFCKPASFTISGAKGQGVVMNASYMCYSPGGSSYTHVTSAPSAYNAFPGKPITFADTCFYTGGAFTTLLPGVVSWNITFNNNLTPDLSMVGCDSGGQQFLPTNCNAGKPTASFNLVFNADQAVTANHINTGDSFKVKIVTGSVSVGITLPSLLINGDRDRGSDAPRVLRRYAGQALGLSNTVGPLVVTSS